MKLLRMDDGQSRPNATGRQSCPTMVGRAPGTDPMTAVCTVSPGENCAPQHGFGARCPASYTFGAGGEWEAHVRLS